MKFKTLNTYMYKDICMFFSNSAIEAVIIVYTNYRKSLTKWKNLIYMH